jgi:adenylate cyclase
MADIFISYSSKDRESAEQLTELLSSAGLSVWIDKQGIDAATSWSKEIVQAIDSCKALLVLLSPNSVVSVNVAKEVSLAAEQKKKILPLDLEPVELTDDLRYHLAGIQRTPMTNIDVIIRAIGKIGLEATQAPTIKLVKETDSRKSLMILPFEDLSPTGDNGWFADGIVSELISALSHVKALRVADQQATKDHKRYTGTLPVYAKQMNVRYFVQGDVRKFGDQIKVTARLLDIETGDHLWQDVLKGKMDDVFEIQEQVATKVIEGLNVILTSDEEKKIAERGTSSSEAYELILKAQEYFARHTKEGFELSVKLCAEAIALDDQYSNAYRRKALALTMLYRSYDRNPELLREAESLCLKTLELKPDRFDTYLPLAQIYTLQGNMEKAEATAMEFVRKDPENYYSHSSLGFFYANTAQYTKAIPALEEAIRLNPNDRVTLYNLVLACHYAKENEKRMRYALQATPMEECHLKLHPDDQVSRQQYANLLFYSDRLEDARKILSELRNASDGSVLYNASAIYSDLGDKQEALTMFRKAIEAGFRNIRHLKEFLTDENEGLVSLAGTPEYEELKQMVEEIEREAEAKKHG